MRSGWRKAVKLDRGTEWNVAGKLEKVRRGIRIFFPFRTALHVLTVYCGVLFVLCVSYSQTIPNVTTEMSWYFKLMFISCAVRRLDFFGITESLDLVHLNILLRLAAIQSRTFCPLVCCLKT
jgi:hypothetical protein